MSLTTSLTTSRIAAEIGDLEAQVDTPALILDLDAFERNLDRLHASVAGLPIKVRPHAKSHKCPQIALQQMARGAVGICCQKVSEAQAFAAAGISDILISNQVVGERKIARLMALAQTATITVCVDDASNASALNAAATAAGIRLRVLIEIDVGAQRCGVAPGAPALKLAQHIAGLHSLELLGLQAYHGPAQHLRTLAERRAAILEAAQAARDTQALLLANGIACQEITGAGTGGYLIEAASGIYTEIQPGSYIFMDADYARNDWSESGMPAFEHSLFVLTSVMSHTAADRAVVDAGLKASSVDSGMPVVADRVGVDYVKASDEHGVLKVAVPGAVKLGDKLRLVPGHCDPTVNLYDQLIGIRAGRVESIWPISARGALL
jgi:3-hydroxy-D-aspartate aldolase